MLSLLRPVSAWATRAPSLAFSRKSSAWLQRLRLTKLRSEVEAHRWTLPAVLSDPTSQNLKGKPSQVPLVLTLAGYGSNVEFTGKQPVEQFTGKSAKQPQSGPWGILQSAPE